MSTALKIFSKQSILVILVGLLVIFTALVGPTFLNPLNVENVARQISFDALVGFGQTIVLLSGGIDISVGSVMAMAASLVMGLQPLDTGWAVLIALLFGSAVGAVNGLLVTRVRIVPFIATLGTMTLVRGMMLTYTREQPIPGNDLGFTFWGAGNVAFVPVPILVVVVVMGLLYVFLTYTRFGRNLYAIGGNREAAHLAGLPLARHQLAAFVLSGTLAAISGILLAARLNSSTIHIGSDTALLSIAAAIMGGASMLGGRGNVIGAFLGVLALGILANGMNLLGVTTYWQIAIRAAILIAVVAVDAFSATVARRRLAPASAAG